jgi:hypothetical protein
MTPKEKAKDLVSIYWNTKVETINVIESIMSKELAIKCALIAVDELIKSSPQKPRSYTDTMLYWQEVKQEIEKL